MTAKIEGLIIDLEQSIEDHPWSMFQKLVLVFAALAFAADGWANQALGVAIPAIIRDWHVTRGAFASVAAAGLVGVAVGTALGGVFGDRLGRRWMLIGSIILFGVATIFAGRVHNIPMMEIVRFVAGFGVGGAIPNVTALVAECTPLRRRSIALGVCMTFNPVGGAIAGYVGSFVLPSSGWQAYFAITGFCALGLALVFLFVLPESPGYLVNRPHRKAELLKILGRFGYGFSSDAEFRSHGRVKASTSVAALFGRESRFDTIALWIAFFTCLMASYSIFSWLPTMLADQGFGLAQASLSLGAFNAGGMAGGLVVGAALTVFGSRGPSLVVAGATALGAVVLGIIPLQPHQGVLLAQVTFAVEGGLVSGLTTVIYALAAGAYPSFIRATAIGSAAAFGRLGAVASSYAAVVALSIGGGSSYFLYIAVLLAMCFVSLLVIKGHPVVMNARRGSTPPNK